jgi:ATP-dependent DNA ligase
MADYIVHKAIELDALSAKAKAALEGNQDWYISPKYDGCHAVFAYDNGKFIGAYSRTGESVKSMDHIGRSLADHYDLSQGRIAICGEAWMVGEEFNVVSGTFRRHAPQPQLQFMPFDIVPFDYNLTNTGPVLLLGQFNDRVYPTPYSKRVASLFKRKNVPSQVLLPRFVLHVGTLAVALKQAEAYAKEHKARTDSFFDGAILAPGNGKYIVGAGKGGEFIKVKPLISHSVKVTAVISDLGAKTKKNTCVLCFDLDGQMQKVSTGIVQEQSDQWAADPSLIIDQMIEVEAMGKTVNNLLREPRFKGIRTDV